MTGPVGAPWTAMATAVAAGLFAAACGYRAVYGGEGAESFAVVLVGCAIADAVACDEAVSGARERLAREGILRGGTDFPRVEVEVTRADEVSEGVAAPPGAVGPRARGVSLGVVLRAWVRNAAGGARERDTGDLRGFALLSVDGAAAAPDPRAAALQGQDGWRAVARRLGQRAAVRAAGFPVPMEESGGLER